MHTGKSLRPDSGTEPESVDDEDIDVPEEVETILEDLLKALQDRVSILPSTNSAVHLITLDAGYYRSIFRCQSRCTNLRAPSFGLLRASARQRHPAVLYPLYGGREFVRYARYS